MQSELAVDKIKPKATIKMLAQPGLEAAKMPTSLRSMGTTKGGGSREHKKETSKQSVVMKRAEKLVRRLS